MAGLRKRFGYTIRGAKVPHEQRILDVIRFMRDDQHLSWRIIARELVKYNTTPRGRAQWQASTIKYLYEQDKASGRETTWAPDLDPEWRRDTALRFIRQQIKWQARNVRRSKPESVKRRERRHAVKRRERAELEAARKATWYPFSIWSPIDVEVLHGGCRYFEVHGPRQYEGQAVAEVFGRLKMRPVKVGHWEDAFVMCPWCSRPSLRVWTDPTGVQRFCLGIHAAKYGGATAADF